MTEKNTIHLKKENNARNDSAEENTLNSTYESYHHDELTPRFIFMTVFFLFMLILTIVTPYAFGPVSISILIYLLIIRYLSPKIGEVISVERKTQKKIYGRGEYVDVTLMVTNNSPHHIKRIELKDLIPDSFILERGSNYQIFDLKPYETIELRYYCSPQKRGRYFIGPIMIKQSMGLHYSKKEFYLEKMTEIAVTPNLHTIKKIPPINRILKYVGGSVTSKELGFDMDFHGIREYSMNDPPRYINWKKTAKYQKLFTNIFNRELSGDIELVLDCTLENSSTFEQAVEALLSMSEYFLNSRFRVGITFLSDFVIRLRQNTGKRQLYRLTNQLIDIQLGKLIDPEVLFSRIRGFAKYMMKDATVILISNLLNPIILDAAFFYRKMGFDVAVFWTQTFTSEKVFLEQIFNTETQNRRLFPLTITKELIELIMHRIRVSCEKNGILLIPWYPHVNLDLQLLHLIINPFFFEKYSRTQQRILKY